MINSSFSDRILSKKAKALYVIARGKDLTKLDVKERAELSMTTVLSAVDALAAEGLVTVGQTKVQRGGKPHSVINLAPDRCVYGISYKSGSLYAAALDLRGEGIARCNLTVAEGVSPVQTVTALAARLNEQAPDPLAVAVALNCREESKVADALAEAYGAEVFLTTNTAALAYRALWEGAPFPLVTIGIGTRVKCAYLGERECRVSDLSHLSLIPAFSRADGCAGVLSAGRVEETLRAARYGDSFGVEGGRAAPCRDLAEYSGLLVRSILALSETARVFYAPREIRLFGEYLTQGFFDRIVASYKGSVPLLRETADGAEFARAAALVALISRFFN